MTGETRSYDVIVIGSGSGMEIVESALNEDLSVALLDRGPLGGTCANVGCVPSKLVIAAADRVMEIQEAARLGIRARIESIDFPAIMGRMQRVVAESREQMRRGVMAAEGLDWYETVGHFVDERTLQVGDTRIRGERVFVVAGARTAVPPIEGLDSVPYLDNTNVFDLRELPRSIVCIGGGYIACEMAHFFGAMGSEVTILQRNTHLVPDEDVDISERLAEVLGKRVDLHLNTEVTRVAPAGQGARVSAVCRSDGRIVTVEAERVLLVAGRQPNTDLLQVERGGIETDARGYIRVNDNLETSAPGVWALGDVIGRQMFKHSANREALIAWHNSQGEEKASLDYDTVPHAVYTWPQIAAVGLTEAQAREDHHILIGHAAYTQVVRGEALAATEGFAKAVVDAHSGEILGFHIIGPYAPILIQEVVNVMALDGRVSAVFSGLHIHPAMPELIVATLANLHSHDHIHGNGHDHGA